MGIPTFLFLNHIVIGEKKSGGCMSTENKKDSGCHKIRNQCQHQNQDSIHKSPNFVSGEIWKVINYKLEQMKWPSLQTFIAATWTGKQSIRLKVSLVNRKGFILKQEKIKIIKMRGSSTSSIPTRFSTQDFHLFPLLDYMTEHSENGVLNSFHGKIKDFIICGIKNLVSH